MKYLVVLALPLLLCGQNPRPSPPKPVVSDSDREISKLKATVETMQAKIRSLDAVLSLVSKRTLSIVGNTLNLDPASLKSYEPIQVGNGFILLASIEDVEPYVDGVRVTLELGNPQSVAFNGCEIKSRYGPRYDFQKYNEKSYTKWQAAVQAKSETFVAVLRSGVWNVISLALPNIKPSEFGYFEVEIKTSSVSLGH